MEIIGGPTERASGLIYCVNVVNVRCVTKMYIHIYTTKSVVFWANCVRRGAVYDSVRHIVHPQMNRLKEPTLLLLDNILYGWALYDIVSILD